MPSTHRTHCCVGLPQAPCPPAPPVPLTARSALSQVDARQLDIQLTTGPVLICLALWDAVCCQHQPAAPQTMHSLIPSPAVLQVQSPLPPPPSPPAPPSPLATRCMRRGGPADRARGCLAWMNRHECMWHGPMPYSVDVVGLLPQADPPLLTHTHAHLHALSCCLCSPPSPPPPTPPSPPDPRCVQHAALHCGLPGAMERPRDVCTDDIHAPESLLVASPG